MVCACTGGVKAYMSISPIHVPLQFQLDAHLSQPHARRQSSMGMISAVSFVSVIHATCELPHHSLGLSQHDSAFLDHQP
jgi:hypothetical protein